MDIKTTNFFHCWRVAGHEEQFKRMGPYRPTCDKAQEINKAKFRNINMLLSVILRHPDNWKKIWKNNRYHLTCDFALNGGKEQIFQRLGIRENRAIIDLHHAIQIPNIKKGKAPISHNKKYLTTPNDDFRRFIIAHDQNALVEFMGICLVSRNTHDIFSSYRHDMIDREWYHDNGIRLPAYWNSESICHKAIGEINDVFDTGYDPAELWDLFNDSIRIDR